jgi:hypothetical protein
MAEPGGRSKQTMVFMVPSDEHDFGARLVEALVGRPFGLPSPATGNQRAITRSYWRRWMSPMGGPRLTYG